MTEDKKLDKDARDFERIVTKINAAMVAAMTSLDQAEKGVDELLPGDLNGAHIRGALTCVKNEVRFLYDGFVASLEYAAKVQERNEGKSDV